MNESTNGRIAAARNRAAGAKRLLAASAAALFATVLVGVRASHSGQPAAAGSGGSTVTDQSSDDARLQNFDFGQSDIGPFAGGSSGSTADTHAS
jgi:hypothetical protein